MELAIRKVQFKLIGGPLIVLLYDVEYLQFNVVRVGRYTVGYIIPEVLLSSFVSKLREAGK